MFYSAMTIAESSNEPGYGEDAGSSYGLSHSNSAGNFSPASGSAASGSSSSHHLLRHHSTASSSSSSVAGGGGPQMHHHHHHHHNPHQRTQL